MARTDLKGKDKQKLDTKIRNTSTFGDLIFLMGFKGHLIDEKFIESEIKSDIQKFDNSNESGKKDLVTETIFLFKFVAQIGEIIEKLAKAEEGQTLQEIAGADTKTRNFIEKLLELKIEEPLGLKREDKISLQDIELFSRLLKIYKPLSEEFKELLKKSNINLNQEDFTLENYIERTKLLMSYSSNFVKKHYLKAIELAEYLVLPEYGANEFTRALTRGNLQDLLKLSRGFPIEYKNEINYHKGFEATLKKNFEARFKRALEDKNPRKLEKFVKKNIGLDVIEAFYKKGKNDNKSSGEKTAQPNSATNNNNQGNAVDKTKFTIEEFIEKLRHLDEKGKIDQFIETLLDIFNKMTTFFHITERKFQFTNKDRFYSNMVEAVERINSSDIKNFKKDGIRRETEQNSAVNK